MVNSETDFSEQRFCPGGVVFAQRRGHVEALRVKAVRLQRGRPVVSFCGVDDIGQAESFMTCELRVPASDQHALPEDQFYLHALVGCLVRTVSGEVVGSVVEVQGVPGANRLIVRRAGGSEAELDIPLAESICVDVDVGRKLVVISPPEGLLDLNG